MASQKKSMKDIGEQHIYPQKKMYYVESNFSN